jgi:hypothetical protein
MAARGMPMKSKVEWLTVGAALSLLGSQVASAQQGTVQDDTWTYHDESLMGGKKMKTRVTIKELSPSAYAFKMDMRGTDGKWTTVMESKGTKVE